MAPVVTMGHVYAMITTMELTAQVKTDSPKRVVTIVYFATIFGHFLASPFNIFHKTDALFVILN